MCLEIWHALKIQHSQFFRRRSWTKRWQLRGSRWLKDSHRTSPYSGVPFYFFLAGAPFYLGHRRPRTVSRAWSDLLQGLTWWGWRLEKFLLGKSLLPPRCYPCLRYNRWGQLPQGWSGSSAFSSKASFIFVLSCQPFQIKILSQCRPKGAELGEGAEKDAGLRHQSCHCWQQGKNEQKKTLCN